MSAASSPNLPLNLPALELLETMAGPVPEDVRQDILTAPLSNDLSGLRKMASDFREPDDWQNVVQPKCEIGDYVESLGFRVPKRFESLGEALHAVRSGKTIIMRSEHPQEYDGFSGLLDSPVVNQAALDKPARGTAQRIRQGMSLEDVIYYAKQDSLDSLPIERYLSLTHQNKYDFLEEMSFSFWEYIPGANVMVVADDAIAGRYHITGKDGASRQEEVRESGWVVDGSGVEEQIFTQSKNVQDVFEVQTRAELIKLYDKIRSLPRFSERQCPIMEFQVDDAGNIWFLQYHKSRPFRAAPEKLSADDYPESKGWHQVQAVRGALGSLVTLRTALKYPTNHRYRSVPDYVPPPGTEDASFDIHYDWGLSEFVSSSRIAYLTESGARRTYLDMADGAHERRSRWFKPHSSLSLGRNVFCAVVTKDIRETLYEWISEKQMGRVTLDVASDGLIGFVRLNPETEDQPLKTPY